MIAKPAKRKQRHFRLQWQIVNFLASSAAYYFRECTGALLTFCKMQRPSRSTLVHPCVTVWNAARECMTWKWCVKSWSRSGFPPFFFGCGGGGGGILTFFRRVGALWPGGDFFFGGVIFSLWHVSPGWHVYVFTYFYSYIYIYTLHFVCLWKDRLFSTAMKEWKNPQKKNIWHDLPFFSSWGDLFWTLGE